MANRAYLLTVNDPSTTWSRDPEREILAEGINEIPVFWASLFIPGDRRIDTYEGDGGELQIPNYCVDAATGKQRVLDLSDSICALLDQRSQDVWRKWVGFISEQEGPLFKTNAAEVWNLGPSRYDEYWATLLRAFSKPSASTMEAASAMNWLRYVDGAVGWDDAEETACKLAGADHIRDVPWLDFGNAAPNQAVSSRPLSSVATQSAAKPSGGSAGPRDGILAGLLRFLLGRSRPNWVEGGLYYTRNDNGSYSVLKILKVDDVGLHIRVYSNQFAEPPSEVDESALYMVGVNRKPDERIGMGHLPFLKRSFEDGWRATFFQQSTVSEDELDGYRMWLEANGGYF